MTLPTDHLEHVEKATQGILKACEDMRDMAREQADAAIRSATALTKGFDEISRNASTLLQDAFTTGVSASKTLMSAKNPRDMMEAQSAFAKDCFDRWVESTGKLSELSARMAQDVMHPISEQANKTMSQIAQKAKAAA
jgi:phasin family protein